MNTKYITHIGWFSAQNFGDDLMARALYESLSELSCPIQYRLASQQRPTLEASDKKWIYPFDLKYESLRKLWLNISNPYSDLMIVGGGSILRSSNGISWKHELYESQKKINPNMKLSGFSLSIGDFKNSKAEKAAQEFIKNFDFAYLRDKFSYDFFKNFNKEGKAILNFDAGASTLNILDRQNIKNVGLCLMAPQDSEERKSHKELIQELRDAGYKINYFVFAATEDLPYVATLANHNESIKVFSGNISNFEHEFDKMSSIFSSRYHGMILAYCKGIPFVGIPPKKVIKKSLEVFNTFQPGFGDTNVAYLNTGKGLIDKLSLLPSESQRMIENSKEGVKIFKQWTRASIC